MSALIQFSDLFNESQIEATFANIDELDVNTVLDIEGNSNQIRLCSGPYVTLNAVQPAANRIYTFPNVGADANIIMSQGNQTINGALTVTSVSTGTLNATNVISTDSQFNQIELLRTGTTYGLLGVSSGSGNYFTGISANQVCIGSADATGRLHLGINMTAGTSQPHITLAPTFMNINSSSLVNTIASTQDVNGLGGTALSCAGGLYIDKSASVNGTISCDTITSKTTNGNLSVSANGTGNVLVNSILFVGGSVTQSFAIPMSIKGSSSTNQYFALHDNTGTQKWHINGGSATGNAINIAESGVADARLYINPGGNVSIGSTSNSFKLNVAGTFNTTSNASITGTLSATSTTTLTGTTDASSTTTGILQVSGGVGISKKLYVGTGLFLPSSGATATTQMDYFEQSYNQDATYTGAFATTVTNGIGLTRVGNMVCMKLLTIIVSPAAASPLNITNAIPSRFRPSAQMYFPIVIQNNGANSSSGLLNLAAAGTMTINPAANTANFTAGAAAGLPADISVSWII